MNEPPIKLSIIIPTYSREKVLLDTLSFLLRLVTPPDEIVVVDQTRDHKPETLRALESLSGQGKIRWIKLERPSIPRAMNIGVREAKGDILLFLDDDIIPSPNLLAVHLRAQEECNIVAGQVLQAGEAPEEDNACDVAFKFSSGKRRYISDLMAGNFSIRRETIVKLGGFDENFLGAAYRFESEFAERALLTGEKIVFEPEAGIRHLKTINGGTRAYGHHLTTIRPHHAVGEYYYIFCSKKIRYKTKTFLKRFFQSIANKHHLCKPWWIPVTLLAETAGFFLAFFLRLRGPRLPFKRKVI